MKAKFFSLPEDADVKVKMVDILHKYAHTKKEKVLMRRALHSLLARIVHFGK